MRQLAIVTGASSELGLELAKHYAQSGYDLLIASDEPEIHNFAGVLRWLGAGSVDALKVDLATRDGVEALCAAAKGRPVAAIVANTGNGLTQVLPEQSSQGLANDESAAGALYLLHRVVSGT